MQISLSKLLAFISWCLFFTSCTTPKHLLPLSKGSQTVLSCDNFKPIFKDNFKSFLFKTTLSYGDKFQQGGLLALKQLSEGNYRTIFMTKFGMTLFDFEFGENGFIVHKTMEQMKLKIFLKIIEQDMEMLLTRGILGSQATQFEKGKFPKKQTIFKTTFNQKKHFFVQERKHKITEIHQNRAVSIFLSKYIANIPRSIHIQHHKMPLNMKLTLLKH